MPKTLLWEIVSVDQHGTPIIQRRKGGNKRAALDAANKWCALKNTLY